MKLLKNLFSPFTLLLTFVLIIATIFPIKNQWAIYLDWLTFSLIVLLFFLYGARLSRASLKSALLHWRLHLNVLFVTFIIFPLFSYVFIYFLTPYLSSILLLGILYLAVLPSTVQSSIAFTSIAGGNLAAAICSASLSSILGIFITPFFITVLFSNQLTNTLSFSDSILKISGQILLPFIIGQLFHYKIGAWIIKKASYFKPIETGSVLLMVYTSFSAAVLSGLWKNFNISELLILSVFCIFLLFLMLLFTYILGKLFNFSIEDQIVLIFCGSKKSLVTGVPMAHVLFPMAGGILLPLMIFHQLQLMVCASLADYFSKRNK